MGEERGMQSLVEEEERGKTVKGRGGQQQKGHLSEQKEWPPS